MTFPFPFFSASVVDLSLAGILSANGLLGNAVMVFDAADSASYSGSGQNYNDTSGNANNLYLGASSSSEGSDPTFVGTAGGLSNGEYFSHDGGDFCRLQGSNPAGIEQFHKNNGIGSGFVAIWVPTGGGASNNFVCGNEGGATNGGFIWSATNGSSKPQILVRASGGNALLVIADTNLAENQWNALAFSLDESVGAGGGFLWRNGAYDQVSAANTFTSTYSSPVATNAPYALELGARGNADTPVVNGTRIACYAFFNAALSKAQLDAIWADLNGARSYV